MRLTVVVAVLGLMVACAILTPRATAQDTDAERIAALETAVAELTE